jgi:hypothetical protein
MKLQITFSQLPMTLTVIQGEEILPNPAAEHNYSVIYNLTENCNTTVKFVDLCKQTIESGEYICSYNLYKPLNETLSSRMKIRMNSIIETINTMDDLPKIDTSLMLDNQSIGVETTKLNALHLYFELTSKDIYSHNTLEFGLLQEINQLVHSLEGGIPSGGGGIWNVLRLTPTENSIHASPLNDEDYNNFVIEHEWGDLLLDYYRVGKDLWAAGTTNDVQLVTTRGLAQQDTVHPCISMECTLFPDANETESALDILVVAYHKWCVDNNVRDYYDIDLPMFNLGRIVLGKLDMTGTTQSEIMTELSKCTSVSNVELIDE